MRDWFSLLLTVTLFIGARPANGQVGVRLELGLSLPSGRYAGDSGKDAGFATLGWTGLADLHGPVAGVGDLEWIVTAGVASHGVQDDYAYRIVSFLGATSGSVGRYWGIPLLGGLGYRIPIGHHTSIQLDGQFGISLLKAPTIEVNDEAVSFDWVAKSTYAVGGGIALSPSLTLLARFVRLGDVGTRARFNNGSVETSLDTSVAHLDFLVALSLG